MGNIVEGSAVCRMSGSKKRPVQGGRSRLDISTTLTCGSCQQSWGVQGVNPTVLWWWCPWCGTRQVIDPPIPVGRDAKGEVFPT